MAQLKLPGVFDELASFSVVKEKRICMRDVCVFSRHSCFLLLISDCTNLDYFLFYSFMYYVQFLRVTSGCYNFDTIDSL